jgi:hypothetical protein
MSDVFTPPEIAKRWKAKPETVRKLLETGQLVGFTVSPIGSKRPRWRISLNAVLAYEAGESTPAPEPPKARRRSGRVAVPAGPF